MLCGGDIGGVVVSQALFILGGAMIAWDAIGHAACLVARLWGPAGLMWNSYSTYVWPRLADSVAYDAFWAAWFFTALALLIAGYAIR